MLDCKELASCVERGNSGEDGGFCIIPEPDVSEIKKSGESSVTLRLGRWFIALRQSSQVYYDVTSEERESQSEIRAARNYFVPFGHDYALHPGRFVLAGTLEWLKFPANLAGYVGGKSTWARRGLIIETAAGIHPGFSGCLTLELANVGEVPIRIRPGMKICQIFVHAVANGSVLSGGPLSGRRRPFLGSLKGDDLLKKLTEK